MLTIASTAAMACALDSPLDEDLKTLLRERRDQLGEYACDLGELARLLIVQPGDTLEAVEAAAGIPIARNRVDGSSYGDPAFEPCWEECRRYGRYWEAVYVLSDDGFGVVLFVEDSEGVDPVLLALCREFGTATGGAQ